MTRVELQKFDFRRSGFISPAVSRIVRLWMSKTASSFVRRWEEMAPSAVPVRAGNPFTQNFATLVENLGEVSTGCVLTLANEKFQSVLTVKRAGLLALVGQVLCDPSDTMPEPRDLTGIEIELAHLLFQGFVASASEAWPQKEPLQITCGAVDPQPHKLRLFGADDFLIVAPLAIDSSAGAVVLEWSLPRQNLTDLIGPLLNNRPGQKPLVINPLETVLDIPVDVTVLLGSANLGMTELCDLVVGDVIVLDQRITDPVQAQVGDERVYAGWPGRIGPTQALKITDRF